VNDRPGFDDVVAIALHHRIAIARWRVDRARAGLGPWIADPTALVAYHIIVGEVLIWAARRRSDGPGSAIPLRGDFC
jgi:hypothetical protein